MQEWRRYGERTLGATAGLEATVLEATFLAKAVAIMI